CPVPRSYRCGLWFCGMLDVCFCSNAFLTGSSGRCPVRLRSAFGGLLFFFFLLWLLLDSAELPEDSLALLQGFAASGELHGENLLDNLVEFRASRHSQRFQFIRHLRQPVANRAPLVEVRANLRERAAVARFRQQISHLF